MKKKTIRNTMIASIIIYIIVIAGAYKCTAQTLVKGIAIETDWAYVAKVWVKNHDTGHWQWADVLETDEVSAPNWYLNRTLSMYVDAYDERQVMFITGNQNCADTTKVIIYGSDEKLIIKDKPNFRKRIKLDGGVYEFGRDKEQPEEFNALEQHLKHPEQNTQ